MPASPVLVTCGSIRQYSLLPSLVSQASGGDHLLQLLQMVEQQQTGAANSANTQQQSAAAASQLAPAASAPANLAGLLSAAVGGSAGTQSGGGAAPGGQAAGGSTAADVQLKLAQQLLLQAQQGQGQDVQQVRGVRGAAVLVWHGWGRAAMRILMLAVAWSTTAHITGGGAAAYAGADRVTWFRAGAGVTSCTRGRVRRGRKAMGQPWVLR